MRESKGHIRACCLSDAVCLFNISSKLGSMFTWSFFAYGTPLIKYFELLYEYNSHFSLADLCLLEGTELFSDWFMFV